MNEKFACELWLNLKNKAEKTIFPTVSKSILPPPPSPPSPFKRVCSIALTFVWTQQRVSLTEICSNYSSNNFGLLFRKSHFYIKLHPKNMWHRVKFQRRRYWRSDKKSRSKRHSGPLRELWKHSKPPITSPHRPNMSEVGAFVGISQRGILSRRKMISAVQSWELRDLTRPLILLDWSRRVTGARIE